MTENKGLNCLVEGAGRMKKNKKTCFSICIAARTPDVFSPLHSSHAGRFSEAREIQADRAFPFLDEPSTAGNDNFFLSRFRETLPVARCRP